MPTLFEKIIARELPADVVFESQSVIAIKDIYPKAPVHLLIITKKPIPNLQSMEVNDLPLLGEIVQVAQQLAKEFGLDEGGYRLLVNNGRHAGQEIDHLHFHLLGGGPLGRMG